MAVTDRRGEVVAILGGAVSLAAATLLALLAIWSQAASGWAAAFQVLGVAGIWLLTFIQLHQQRLVAEERMEVAELERQRRDLLGGATTIFDEEEIGQMEKLAMGRRLITIERYLVPTLALLVAAYHLAAGISVLPWIRPFPPIAAAGDGPIDHASAVLFFAGALAFVCFMLSRYALGMSRLPQWGLLRAGGNFMFGSSATCLAVALALLCSLSGLPRVETWLARAVGFVLIALAVETVVNYILDFYRPRIRGAAQRPFYDSRLLGMFSEPGGILRSMANAVDYQFGFKVSETWFYRLLGRIVLPLLLVQVAVILALTCIVVVPPGHQAVIEHFGRPLPRTARPGIHLTWCWPIDRAHIIPVELVQRLEIGFERDPADAPGARAEGAILWTRKHYKKEYQLLVADRAAAARAKVPINLVSMNMPVQWRVRDEDEQVLRYHAQAAGVAGIVESLAYQELTRYAAQADLLDLLGRGGIEAAATLHRRLQAACDRAGYDGAGLGVQIVHVGIGGVHPPPDLDVAKSYEEVVGADEKRDARIKSALGDAAQIRLSAAGERWQELYNAILAEDQAAAASAPDLAARREAVEKLLRTEAGGLARAAVARALMRTVARVYEVRSAAELYSLQIDAYRAAPEYYLLGSYLRILEEGLRDMRMFIILLADPARIIYELDLKPPPGIDVLGAELSATEAARK
jgi:regulator of protease activity HflC (stomatin/prohibitin superfamily)